MIVIILEPEYLISLQVHVSQRWIIRNIIITFKLQFLVFSQFGPPPQTPPHAERKNQYCGRTTFQHAGPPLINNEYRVMIAYEWSHTFWWSLIHLQQLSGLPTQVKCVCTVLRYRYAIKFVYENKSLECLVNHSGIFLYVGRQWFPFAWFYYHEFGKIRREQSSLFYLWQIWKL